ncbi:MAG: 30S ribosomal protein S4 [Candidatus Nealsonbacteria bacterium]|nr:30S ribosomal protein S4 [Candidatus Nealsonbacteria bacterium]
MTTEQCKICRRQGIKLFLKGERCYGQKCGIVKRNYPPGIRSKRRGKKISEYGRALMEKQKMRHWYNLSESQFSKYVKNILDKKERSEGAGDLLVKRIESRLDNIIFRLGFTLSHRDARQMVNHGHFMVNGRKVDIPSYEVKKGDEIEVKAGSKKKKEFEDIKASLKNFTPPVWLSLDKEGMKVKVLSLPTEEEANVPVETTVVFEFYSK